MAEYRRFVTYIFYYENNQKIRCVGSAKIEQRGTKGRIELSVRGAGSLRGKLPFYFFIRQGRRIQGILLGEVNLRGGSGHLAQQFDASSIAATKVTLAQVAGFVIWAGKECQLGSQWDDLPTDWRNLQRETEAEKQEESPEIIEEATLQAAEKLSEGKREQTDEKKDEQKPGQRMVLENIESDIPEKYGLNKEQILWQKNWEEIKKTHKTEQMFSGEQKAVCIRMELRDLRLLPRRYWYLGNNSFLLHGFFNYQHLILGCSENGGKPRWFVGVPGIFHNQEQVMAAFFGFHRFCLEKSAPYRTGGFGYWCLDMEL